MIWLHRIAGAVVAFIVFTPSASGQPEWTERSPLDPGARSGHSMAFDSVRERIMLCGSSQLLEWSGDSETWTERCADSPCGTPTLDWRPMAYDSRRQVLIKHAQNGYTYEFNGTRWENKNASVPTGETATPGMAYDSARGVTVLYGGDICCTSGFPSNRTFEWDGSTWTERFSQDGQRPARRKGTAMAYDSRRGRCVLFGGTTVNVSRTYDINDTWEWDGTNWILMNASSPLRPAARHHHAMAYDSNRGVTVLFGGVSDSGVVFGDTWEWDGEQWRDVTPVPSPSPRSGHALAYDASRGETILFGGLAADGESQGDTWALFVPECADGRLGGRLLFEDRQTRVRITGGPRATVRAYTHSDETLHFFETEVDEAGKYRFEPGELPPGAYDLVAVYEIPSQFRHAGYATSVLQPYDTDQVPDVIIEVDERPDKCPIDIVFPWPAILLHGLVAAPWDDGVSDFEKLQPYLSVANEADLLSTDTKRKGILSLAPDLTQHGSRSIADYYFEFLFQTPDLLAPFPPSTKFRLVGYSQGGLLARALIQFPVYDLGPARFVEVLQLGTPNAGTCVAVDHGADDVTDVPWLTPTAIARFNRHVFDGRGIPFTVVAGIRGTCLAAPGYPSFNACLFDAFCFPVTPNDTWVERDSVLSLQSPFYNVLEIEARLTHSQLVRNVRALPGIQEILAD